MAEYKQKEAAKVTDDSVLAHDVEVPPSKPLVTISGEDGQSVSYPQRTFKPEEPKGEATVTLKTSGEIHDGSGRVADKAVVVGMSLAMAVSMVLMVARKIGFRSPVDAP